MASVEVARGRNPVDTGEAGIGYETVIHVPRQVGSLAVEGKVFYETPRYGDPAEQNLLHGNYD